MGTDNRVAWIAVGLIVVGAFAVLYDQASCLFAGALGAVVGLAELLSRYRDDSLRMMRQAPALLYILLNACVAALALFVLQHFSGGEGATTAKKSDVIGEVFAAGFGSMAILRSAFLTARVGGQDVQVGPGLILKYILDAVDRAVDRGRAADRCEKIHRVMKDVDFDKGHVVLPLLCLGASQNLGADDQKELKDQIDQLARTRKDAPTLDPRVLSVALGMQLSRGFGTEVLESVVTIYGSMVPGAVAAPPSPPPPVPAPPAPTPPSPPPPAPAPPAVPAVVPTPSG